MHLFSATFEAQNLQGEDSLESLSNADDGKANLQTLHGEQKIGSHVPALILVSPVRGRPRTVKLRGFPQTVFLRNRVSFPTRALNVQLFPEFSVRSRPSKGWTWPWCQRMVRRKADLGVQI